MGQLIKVESPGDTAKTREYLTLDIGRVLSEDELAVLSAVATHEPAPGAH